MKYFCKAEFRYGIRVRKTKHCFTNCLQLSKHPVYVSNLQCFRIFILLPALLCLRRLCTAEAIMYSLCPVVSMSHVNMDSSKGRASPLHTCSGGIMNVHGLYIHLYSLRKSSKEENKQ